MSDPTEPPRPDDSGFTQPNPTAGGPAQPAYSPPPAKKGMSTGAKVGIGCGAVAILVLLAGCVGVVIFGVAAKDSVDEVLSTTTTIAGESGSTSSVTLNAYNQIQNGQSLQEVQNILGGPGKSIASSDIAGTTIATYSWDAPNFGSVTIVFSDNVVQSKSQFGLE